MIRAFRLFEGVRLPERANAADAAFDVYAYKRQLLRPGEIHAISTGLVLSVPTGYVIQVLPRSGLARDHGITVANSPGLVDPGYRGEVEVVLINHGSESYMVEKDHRIAQLLPVPFAQAAIHEVESKADLHPSPDNRGEGGFGSTGL